MNKDQLRLEIEQQTQEFLDNGGEIEEIEFLHTTFYNVDVVEYKRIHRRGYYMYGAPTLGAKGKELIEQAKDGLVLEEI